MMIMATATTMQDLEEGPAKKEKIGAGTKTLSTIIEITPNFVLNNADEKKTAK